MLHMENIMHGFGRVFAVAALGLGSVAAGMPAHASLILTASLFTPQPIPGTTTVIGVQGIVPPSQTAIIAPGYMVSFSGGVTADQGVVHGTLPGGHATPVAGVSGGNPEYLTGDFDSALTTNIADSGNYLSTGLGTITISFTKNQDALAGLWGSIDTGNLLTLLESGTPVGSVTGTQVQTAASGFVGNGFQGPGGSAYVAINSTLPFNEIELTSSVVSFEMNGIVGSTSPIGDPEPTSLMLLGAGLVGLCLIRRRRA
jgi:PEP-CTERM motif